MNKIKWVVYLVVFASLALFLPSFVFASTLSLSPGGGNIYIGGTKTVAVVLNAGGDAVNGVSAYLSYPADKVDIAWVSPGGAFAIQAENSFGGGVIKISRGSFSGVSGSVTVATIGLRGKAAGSAAISFIGGSSAPRVSDSSDSLNLGGSGGGVYTVGGSAPAPTKATNASGNSTAEKIVLTLSDLKVTSAAADSAVISWTTNVEADSLVDFGLDADKYFLNASNGQLTKEHSIKLESPLFVAGLLLHFKATSKTESSVASSKDAVLQLPGYSVQIKLTDRSGKPVAGATVTLYSSPMQAVSDQKGEVSFQNVSPGKHALLVRGQGIDKSVEVEIKESSPVSAPQVFTVSVDASQVSSQNTSRLPFVYIGAAVGILALVVLFVFGRKFLKSRIFPPKPSQNPVTVENEKKLP